ncbi:tripartite motif-containing protein 67 [Stylonychia lemnae]|uniref:Tripartite motif-containing protein 67 n=1 Tax=Stylonychia lemnae TaxID=5949 RepID=A0A078AQC3_STYLE|nr:tripartite motif-containing protein 67 [Stylonychia lemnae]|eukprot:CDW84151.1 tripartite motif-containing protein 67 [Stylonychia lemnae]
MSNSQLHIQLNELLKCSECFCSVLSKDFKLSKCCNTLICDQCIISQKDDKENSTQTLAIQAKNLNQTVSYDQSCQKCHIQRVKYTRKSSYHLLSTLANRYLQDQQLIQQKNCQRCEEQDATEVRTQLEQQQKNLINQVDKYYDQKSSKVNLNYQALTKQQQQNDFITQICQFISGNVYKQQNKIIISNLEQAFSNDINFEQDSDTFNKQIKHISSFIDENLSNMKKLVVQFESNIDLKLDSEEINHDDQQRFDFQQMIQREQSHAKFDSLCNISQVQDSVQSQKKSDYKLHLESSMVITENQESKILRESNMHSQQKINQTYCAIDKGDLIKSEAENDEDSIYKPQNSKVIQTQRDIRASAGNLFSNSLKNKSILNRQSSSQTSNSSMNVNAQLKNQNSKKLVTNISSNQPLETSINIVNNLNFSTHLEKVTSIQVSQRGSVKNFSNQSNLNNSGTFQGSASSRQNSSMRNKLSNFASNSTATPATQRNQNINDYLSQPNYSSNPNQSIDQRHQSSQSSVRRSRGEVGMSQSRRLASQADKEAEEQARVEKEQMEVLNKDPLSVRKFTNICVTSNAIQVSWNHPNQLMKDKKALLYELQYGIGNKVNNKEQFRKIYQGKAHRCIITDLNSKTNYRFRVAPIIQKTKEEGGNQVGVWSEPITVQTKDIQNFDPNTFGNCAQLISKNPTQSSGQSATFQERLINFTQAGTIASIYGYSFGEHLWSFRIKFEEQLNLANSDLSGIMIVGVINKKSSVVSNKLYGGIVNYTLQGGDILVKVYLDANKRTMTIFTSSKPEGEVFTDLPKDGLFYPAIQNKTQKFSKNAKLYVGYKFDLPIPSDKQKIKLDDIPENQEFLGSNFLEQINEIPCQKVEVS